jgi:hypothetical protein
MTMVVVRLSRTDERKKVRKPTCVCACEVCEVCVCVLCVCVCV